MYMYRWSNATQLPLETTLEQHNHFIAGGCDRLRCECIYTAALAARDRNA